MPGYRIRGPILDDDDFDRIAAGDIHSVLAEIGQPTASDSDPAAVAGRRRRNKTARKQRRINRRAAKR